MTTLALSFASFQCGLTNFVTKYYVKSEKESSLKNKENFEPPPVCLPS